MKNKTIIRVTLICTLAFISSCTIQKRTFRSGYHVVWNKKYTTSNANDSHKRDLAVKEIEENSTVNEVVDLENKLSIEDVLPLVDDAVNRSSISETNSLDAVIEDEAVIDDEKVFFSQNTISTVSTVSKNSAHSQSLDKKTKNTKKTSSEGSNGGKLQIVALILCILLGLLGIHRFYLGYTGLGVLYLLTLGLFGIGWIIDIILLIIPNGLTPKGRNNYKE